MTGDGGPGAGQGPIEAATAQLTGWLEQVTGAPIAAGGLSLWALELCADRQVRGTGQREPFRFRVRHLVTVADPGAGPASFRLLDQVLVAAVRAGEPSVSLEPPAAHVWQGLGLAPRPALLIDVPAQINPEIPSTPLVRGPLRLRHVALRPLDGRVLGPGDQPVPGMRVEVAGTPAFTYTDARGLFHFAGVPADTRIELRLRGRNRSMVAQVEPAAVGGPDEPLVIHCEFEES